MLLITAGCVTACASAAEEVTPEARSDTVVRALRDAVVTPNEYRSAVRQFVSCLHRAGYTAEARGVSPVDGLSRPVDITPSGDPDVYNAEVQKCNVASIAHLEPVYVENNIQVMAPPLREHVRKCLSRAGVRTTGSETNAPEFFASADGDKGPVVTCITKSAHRLYPSLPLPITIRG
ncbi:hypothetical protein ABZT03_25535 [Streptomyces sp. NPDC005574]|uniref:hypothetical protein n=1 Tax=Streptomyces sp. NPDC005574 TaxID=3156891 RepID=UPI0033A0A912